MWRERDPRLEDVECHFIPVEVSWPPWGREHPFPWWPRASTRKGYKWPFAISSSLRAPLAFFDRYLASKLWIWICFWFTNRNFLMHMDDYETLTKNWTRLGTQRWKPCILNTRKVSYLPTQNSKTYEWVTETFRTQWWTIWEHIQVWL